MEDYMQFPNINFTVASISLIIFSVLCFILTYLVTNADLKSIFINFGTDAIFLLFVIFVIDKLIEKHENSDDTQYRHYNPSFYSFAA